jgi:HEAT repeat protein
VRARAARALSRCGRHGIEALIDAVGGPDHYARDAALAALGHLELPPQAKERVAAHFIALEAAGELGQQAG